MDTGKPLFRVRVKHTRSLAGFSTAYLLQAPSAEEASTQAMRCAALGARMAAAIEADRQAQAETMQRMHDAERAAAKTQVLVVDEVAGSAQVIAADELERRLKDIRETGRKVGVRETLLLAELSAKAGKPVDAAVEFTPEAARFKRLCSPARRGKVRR